MFISYVGSLVIQHMEKLETFGMLTLNLRNTTMGEKKKPIMPKPNLCLDGVQRAAAVGEIYHRNRKADMFKSYSSNTMPLHMYQKSPETKFHILSFLTYSVISFENMEYLFRQNMIQTRWNQIPPI